MQKEVGGGGGSLISMLGQDRPVTIALWPLCPFLLPLFALSVLDARRQTGWTAQLHIMTTCLSEEDAFVSEDI